MAGASEQLTRLLTLIPWLVAHPGVSKTDAARTFGISTGQLERDLEIAACAEVGRNTLASLDIDYWDDEVTVIEAQSVDRPLELRVDEAVTLLVGLRSLAAVPGLTDREVVDQALTKIEALIGSLASTVRAVDTPGGGPPDAVLEAVQQALRQQRRLRIDYWTPARDQLSTRDVDPMRIVTVGTVGYLQGWCYLAEDVRTFRLDRVQGATVLEEAAAPPSEAHVADVAQPGVRWVGASGDVEVTLDLAPEARWVVDYHPVDSAEELGNGGLRVTLRTPHLAWARRLVLRLAGGARVVAPLELEESVRATAAEALAGYR